MTNLNQKCSSLNGVFNFFFDALSVVTIEIKNNYIDVAPRIFSLKVLFVSRS